MVEPHEPTGEIVLYRADDGRTRIECRFADESLWLSQALMAELFQATPQNITLHLKARYEEGEIEEAATCKEYLRVRREASDQARRRKQVFLGDWDRKLDEFLAFNERRVLPDKGAVSKAAAAALAETQYAAFAARRRALAEAEGERARQAALESAAKHLPSPKGRQPRARRKKGSGE